jgi:hypothetical protein
VKCGGVVVKQRKKLRDVSSLNMNAKKMMKMRRIQKRSYKINSSSLRM